MASTLTLASRDLVEELAAELGHDPSAVHTVLLRILRKHGWHPAPEKELVQGHELRAKRKKAMSWMIIDLAAARKRRMLTVLVELLVIPGRVKAG